jgi:ribosomal protein L21E
MNDSNLTTKLSAIDKALAAAKARKGVKTDSDSTDVENDQQTDDIEVKKVTQPDFAKAQKKAALDSMRAEAKAKRDSERLERRAAKLANAGKPVHMKKINNAAEKLPALDERTQLLFNESTVNLGVQQIAALSLHLQHFNRLKATERALDQKLELGQTVDIISGDPKYVGKTGTVTGVRRIRCFVEVEGLTKPVYLFTSDVRVVESVSTREVLTG